MLQLVRYFLHDESQNGIVGWHLDLETLQFLVSISASIDADEYEFDD